MTLLHSWLPIRRVALPRAGLFALALLTAAGLACAADDEETPWLEKATEAPRTFSIDKLQTFTVSQTSNLVYGIDPAARSRLNALLFTGMFIGMSAGAALGALVLAQWGWLGVVGLATVSSLAALGVRVARRAG